MGFGKDGKGQVLWDLVTITLGALAARDVISQASTTGSALKEDFRILKTKYYIAWRAPDFAEGPIVIGMAPGQMSAAEIEEALESTPTDTSDVPEIEQSNRMVWPLEIMMLQNDGTLSDGGKAIAQGEVMTKWTFPDPDGWNWWTFNLDSVAPLTTNGRIEIFAKHFGVWVR